MPNSKALSTSTIYTIQCCSDKKEMKWNRNIKKISAFLGNYERLPTEPNNRPANQATDQTNKPQMAMRVHREVQKI